MALSHYLAVLCALLVLSAVTLGAEAAEVNEQMLQSSGTLPKTATAGAIRLAHCCHSHPRPPYDRYCCHSGAAYVAPVYRRYGGSVRRSSRRVSRRTGRRVGRRR